MRPATDPFLGREHVMKALARKAMADAPIRVGDVCNAYMRQYPTGPDSTAPRYVEDVVMSDDGNAVIVCEGDCKYRVPFTIKDGEIEFDTDATTEVALTYQEKSEQAATMKRYTLGVVYSPNDGPDAHGDTMSAEEVEKAAWKFLHKAKVGLMHEDGTEGAGTVVESYVYRGKPWTLKDVGGEEQTIREGDWLLGVVWEPEAWASIQKGLITGYSLQGWATQEPLQKSGRISFANIFGGR